MNCLPSRKWLGVRYNVSLMSQFTWVSGHELSRLSHSTKIVGNRSLECLSDPRFNKKTRLMIEKRRSQNEEQMVG